MDVYEINKAFASQALYTERVLSIHREKVNLNGGAIEISHLLGCTGASQVATLCSLLNRQVKKVSVTSMCIGSSMGMAAAWEKE